MTRSLKSADVLSAIMASAVLHEDSFKLSLSGQPPSTFCRSASHVLAFCTAGSIAFLKTACNASKASAVASVLLRLPATAPQPPSGFWPSNKRFSDSSNTTSVLLWFYCVNFMLTVGAGKNHLRSGVERVDNE